MEGRTDGQREVAVAVAQSNDHTKTGTSDERISKICSTFDKD